MGRFVTFVGPLVFSISLAGVWSCSKHEAKAEPPTAVNVAAATAANGSLATEATGPAAAPKFDDVAFEVAMVATGPIKAGQPSAVEVRLKAKSPYHCNDKYPYKFKPKATDGIEFEEPVVRSEKGKLEKSTFTLPIRFTPKAAGPHRIEGQFSFSVCTDDRCLVERRDLALPVEVQ